MNNIPIVLHRSLQLYVCKHLGSNILMLRNMVQQQSGAVLIISLIILLLLTLIGVTAIQSSLLEEKMAANMRNRNLAFQAAESALREAVTTLCPAPLSSNHCVAVPTTIQPLTNKKITSCANGLCPYSSTVTPEFYSTSFDWVTKGIAYSGSLSNITQVPRYVIEMIAPALSGSTIVTFRVTVTAWGADTNSEVKLQIVHKIDYSGSDPAMI
ncbi:MAG: PilX N-terminal domain-containing pilus assembly protein [Methylococcales bacterium]|nr:PilX N-terminal domain-containing pilus assembly protein [Methylococcales bacterium]